MSQANDFACSIFGLSANRNEKEDGFIEKKDFVLSADNANKKSKSQTAISHLEISEDNKTKIRNGDITKTELTFCGVDPGMSKTSPGAMSFITVSLKAIRDSIHTKKSALAIITDEKLWAKVLVEYQVNEWRSEGDMTAFFIDNIRRKGFKLQEIYLEEVGAQSYTVVDRRTGAKSRTSQKGTNNFNFGQNYGFYRGLFASAHYTNGIPLFKTIKPQDWHKVIKLRAKRDANDKPALDLARSLFPGSSDSFLKFKKDHGKAEALTIAVSAVINNIPRVILE